MPAGQGDPRNLDTYNDGEEEAYYGPKDEVELYERVMERLARAQEELTALGRLFDEAFGEFAAR